MMDIGVTDLPPPKNDCIGFAWLHGGLWLLLHVFMQNAFYRFYDMARSFCNQDFQLNTLVLQSKVKHIVEL